MELNEKPTSCKFTAAVAVRIVATTGTDCANFEAGQTREIPRALFDAALLAGLVPEGPLEPTPPPPENKSAEETKEVGLVAACKVLITKGLPKDFLISGQPRAASVKKLVDFNFTNKDVERAFLQAMHEVEQHGDESTEHSEPSSSTSE